MTQRGIHIQNVNAANIKSHIKIVRISPIGPHKKPEQLTQ